MNAKEYGKIFELINMTVEDAEYNALELHQRYFPDITVQELVPTEKRNITNANKFYQKVKQVLGRPLTEFEFEEVKAFARQQGLNL